MTREDIATLKDAVNKPYKEGLVYIGDLGMRQYLLRLIQDLESAWARIDDLERQNRDLTIERDDAVRRLNEVVDRHTTQDLGTPRSGIE